MKKTLLLLALLLIAFTVSLSAQSFEFMNRQVIFGSNPETFLETYPEFSENSEFTSESQKSVSYIVSPGNCEVTFTVTFENSALVCFELHSNCTVMEDQSIIDAILNQFTFIPSDDPEEDMGDVVEYYVKGNLSASAFIGGFYKLTISRSE